MSSTYISPEDFQPLESERQKLEQKLNDLNQVIESISEGLENPINEIISLAKDIGNIEYQKRTVRVAINALSKFAASLTSTKSKPSSKPSSKSSSKSSSESSLEQPFNIGDIVKSKKKNNNLRFEVRKIEKAKGGWRIFDKERNFYRSSEFVLEKETEKSSATNETTPIVEVKLPDPWTETEMKSESTLFEEITRNDLELSVLLYSVKNEIEKEGQELKVKEYFPDDRSLHCYIPHTDGKNKIYLKPAKKQLWEYSDSPEREGDKSDCLSISTKGIKPELRTKLESLLPPVVKPVVAVEPPVKEPVVAVEPPVVEPVVAVEPPVVEPVVAVEPPVNEPVKAIEPAVVKPVVAIEPSVKESVEAVEESEVPEVIEEQTSKIPFIEKKDGIYLGKGIKYGLNTLNHNELMNDDALPPDSAYDKKIWKGFAEAAGVATKE